MFCKLPSEVGRKPRLVMHLIQRSSNRSEFDFSTSTLHLSLVFHHRRVCLLWMLAYSTWPPFLDEPDFGGGEKLEYEREAIETVKQGGTKKLWGSGARFTMAMLVIHSWQNQNIPLSRYSIYWASGGRRKSTRSTSRIDSIHYLRLLRLWFVMSFPKILGRLSFHEVTLILICHEP